MNNDIGIIAGYWNNYAPDFDEAHSEENIDEWKASLVELLNKTEGLKILDIGTGTGFLALMLVELGCHSTGIDIADDMLAIGKKHAADKNLDVEFVSGQGEKMPFEDNSFDAVVNARLIWTLVDPVESFTEWKRVLKNGGKVLSFMRYKDDGSDVFSGYDELDDRLPLRNAPKEKAVEAMEKAGYKNCKAIKMPEELTYSDLGPWFCIYGEK